MERSLTRVDVPRSQRWVGPVSADERPPRQSAPRWSRTALVGAYAVAGTYYGGGGGGGGRGQSTAYQSTAPGGHGGTFGGGGGGGGAGTRYASGTVPSGAGGDGADGFVRITTWF